MTDKGRADTQILLASLGLAATALAAGNPAEAAVVIQTFGQDVGFKAGSATSAITIPLLSPGGFHLFPVALGSGASQTNAIVASSFPIASKSTFYTTSFPTCSCTSGPVLLKAVPAGFAWDYGTGSSAAPGGVISYAIISDSYRAQSSNLYFVFNFGTSSNNHYGWFSGSVVNNGFSSVYFHLNSVAYNETANQQLAAGATVAPEPPSLALLALGALVTGAAATRRYKRARTA